MRFTSLHVAGFRSLRDVQVTDLGPAVILYGPNGAGKSNLLDAARLALRFARSVGLPDEPQLPAEDRTRPPMFRLRLAFTAIATAPDGTSAEIDFTYEQSPGPDGGSRPDRAELRVDGKEARPAWLGPVLARGVAHVPATRLTRRDSIEEQDLAVLLERGHVAQAFVHARVHRDLAVRKAFESLRDVLTGPPLHRPPFDPVHDTRTDTYLLEERVVRGQEEIALPVDLGGLGLQQLYTIVGATLLHGSRIATLEEPEAHLHAPTTGRQLREVLARLLGLDGGTGHLDQLWIATHSNLFDLDPGGYHDVRLDPDRGTVVERRPLADLDARHLYEPGPARHALLDLVRVVPPDTVFFRDDSGKPVDADMLLRALQSDDETALAFLREIQATAVAIVQRRRSRPA